MRTRFFARLLVAGVLAAALFLTTQQASAQSFRKYSNEFLGLGVGARALALGGAASTRAEDVTAGYWNPSLLVNSKYARDFTFMHNEYFLSSSNFDYGALALNLDDENALSLSIIRFATDNIPNTLALIDPTGVVNYNAVTGFSAADYGFLGTYSRLISDKLSLGGNFKVIHRSIGPFAKAWGFGIDLAGTYQPTEKLRVAAVLRDATSTFNAWTYNRALLRDVFTATGNTLPKNGIENTAPSLVLGSSYQIGIGEMFGITPSLDFYNYFDGPRNTLLSGGWSIDPRFGLEAHYNELVYLRGGLSRIQRITDLEGNRNLALRPSAGIGVSYKGARIDYAITDAGTGVNQVSNVISLSFGIAKE